MFFVALQDERIPPELNPFAEEDEEKGGDVVEDDKFEAELVAAAEAVERNCEVPHANNFSGSMGCDGVLSDCDESALVEAVRRFEENVE